MPKFIDRTGHVYGPVTAIKCGRRPTKHIKWLCRCICGEERWLVDTQLQRLQRFEGCRCHTRRELHGEGGGKHKRYSPEYKVWERIKRRCLHEKDPAYKHYGGRGLTIAKEWLHSYSAFLLSMGRRPTPKHTIERVDNNKGYSPQNCVWATRAAQSRNHRNNHNITFRGKTACLTDWARELNMEPVTLTGRLRRGWSIKKALTTPVKKRQQH